MDRDDDAPASPLNGLDAAAARLRAAWPAWKVWYVPRAVSRDATWHAQPRRYPLAAAGPDELAEAIAADEA
jgi:hypothetical protein